MNVLDRIKKDHELQRSLMQQILQTEGDSDRRRDLFSEFLSEYKAHAAAEEHAFYAELMKKPGSTDQSRHSVAEHAEAIEIVEKLESLDMSDPEWLKTFKKLEQENEHHMEEEEDDVFPLARKTLGEPRLSELVDTFDQRKKEECDSISD